VRILTAADVLPDPNRGAAGTEVQTIAALRASGHEVDSIWADVLGRHIRHGNLHLLLELPRTYEREIVRAIERRSYDVIHVNQPHGYRAARAVHRRRAPAVFVHRSHGFEPNVEATLAPWRARFHVTRGSAMRRLMSRAVAALLARHSREIASEADGHIVSSSLDADFLAMHYDVDRGKIAVIPQAAPNPYVQVEAPPMTAERLQRVLHVAQLAFFKAPMITADAINRLVRDPTRTFTWVCDRTSHPAARALLSSEANARTELLPWTTQDALREIYDAHGIFLFPSFFEGFGKAFLEAMSRGLCVVASDVGGMHDVITHGIDGVLVPPGDAEALADAVRALTPERAASMSTAAAQTARRYTWERVARETAAFYRRLMESHR
jgi:glycosyltransferase involved in cell wall biosynthesis